MVKGSRGTDTWIKVGLIGAKLGTVEHAPKISKEKEVVEDETVTVRVKDKENNLVA